MFGVMTFFLSSEFRYERFLDLSHFYLAFCFSKESFRINDNRKLVSLQIEGLEKVLNIFMSESIEDDVRKSAAEQLSAMLHGIYFIFTFIYTQMYASANTDALLKVQHAISWFLLKIWYP